MLINKESSYIYCNSTHNPQPRTHAIYKIFIILKAHKEIALPYIYQKRIRES
jgi:hypothetical protein